MLPEAITRAFEAESMKNLGGLMLVAGLDPVEALGMGKSVKDHPWVGRSVSFPYPEVGVGTIIRCIVHPRGKLMFDVEFPERMSRTSARGIRPSVSLGGTSLDGCGKASPSIASSPTNS